MKKQNKAKKEEIKRGSQEKGRKGAKQKRLDKDKKEVNKRTKLGDIKGRAQ